ncbi:right-handed parallel beta-helix repeat-containing protein, partial [Proteiniphilum sp. X52]|uniref:right-handed parallel beta-helix repeat-containing protein n=1 Tax=Proteiniphilum sp. X52 TaxID=2382159 RepID=UPI000F41D386
MKKFIYYFILLFFAVVFIHCEDELIPPPKEIIPEEIITCYYVSTSGDDTNTGITKQDAWKTISYAAKEANPGDTILIEGGNYDNENVVIANAGSEASPIVFMGYNGTPVLDGKDWLSVGIHISKKDYIVLKNIKVKNYRTGILIESTKNNTLDGVIVDSCCNTDYANKGWDGYGIQLKYAENALIKNCSTTDNGGNNIHLFKSNNCTLEDCKSYSKQSEDNQFATDYYIVLEWSSNNTIRNCHTENTTGWGKGDHGIIIKDNPSTTGTHSTNNRFVNCTSKNFEECISFSHGAHHNVADSCYADNTGKSGGFNTCLMVRDGAEYNTFSNCKAVGKTQVVTVYDGSREGGVNQMQTGNKFVNCIFEKGIIGAYFRSSVNTTFKNCNFVNITHLFRFSVTAYGGADDNSGTLLRNCILSGVTKQYETISRNGGWGLWTGSAYSNEAGYSDMDDVTFEYTNFWNGFARITGTGNTAVDPLFADETNSDYHLKSEEGRWNGNGWITDNVTSPCINAGNPNDEYSKEPSPNGERVNMGAYGNTAEASKSSEVVAPPADDNKITLVTEKAAGEKIKIALYAAVEDQADVWIDLNDNGKKDANETPAFTVPSTGPVATGFVEFEIGAQTVHIYGKVYRLDCPKNRITALLSNKELRNLFCYGNKITGANATALMNSLPDRNEIGSAGTLAFIDTTVPDEQNRATKADVNIAVAKKWGVYDYRGSNANKVPYEGEPDDVDKITLVTEKAVGEKIKIALYAAAEDQADVWIDLNNNGKKDANETPAFTVPSTGPIATGFVEFEIGAQTVHIYGKVYRLDCPKNRITALLSNKELRNLFCYGNK